MKSVCPVYVIPLQMPMAAIEQYGEDNSEALQAEICSPLYSLY